MRVTMFRSDLLEGRYLEARLDVCLGYYRLIRICIVLVGI